MNSELKKGYPERDFGMPTKRYVQTLAISEDPELQELYRRCHAEENAWKEVLEGIREVGILEMELYMHGNIMTMIVETPLDFDWDSAMARLATLPRQAEWEAYVARFQGCDPSAPSDRKWQLMDRIFHLYES
ncbi:MAG: L-rhamnose mutarotase [Muribaculaceae bacterium]|nr:L-rhamnose mutarotase [Muribaculaceae bacterium]